MPSAPPRVCRRCGGLATKNKPCSCRPAWEGSTHPSGNDRGWQAISAAKKHDAPICEWVEDDGTLCFRPTDVVDHVTPLAEGGSRYDWDNLQSLCHSHHDVKTAQDARRGKTRLR